MTINRVSFSGGMGGVMARPSRAELAAAGERHVGPSSQQREQESFARSDSALRASDNGGRPPIAATPRPAAFNVRGVVAARDVGTPRTTQAAAQYRSDRPVQTAQVNAPQYRSERPVQTAQVNAGQYRSDRPVQTAQVNAPQYRSERPAQPVQGTAAQYRAARPTPAVGGCAAVPHRARAAAGTESAGQHAPAGAGCAGTPADAGGPAQRATGEHSPEPRPLNRSR